MRLVDLPLKQQQAVKLTRYGKSIKQIAVIMEVEEQTVKNMLRDVYRKTKTHGRVELILHFYSLQEKAA